KAQTDHSIYEANPETASSALCQKKAATTQSKQPEQMPMPASIACFLPSTAAVRNTKAVSNPGVIVNKPAAKVNENNACPTVIGTELVIAFPLRVEKQFLKTSWRPLASDQNALVLN